MKQYIQNSFLVLALLFFLGQSSIFAQGKNAYQQAEIYRKENKHAQAIKKYNEAISKESDNYKYYFQRGRSEFALRKYAYARVSFQKTVDLRSNFSSGYAWIAKTAKKLKKTDEAIANYELAAEYETNKPVQLQYYLLLINLLVEENKIDKAKEVLIDARALSSSNENILYFEGKIAEKEKRWKDAQKFYQTALTSKGLQGASDGAKAKFYYGLGLAKKELGDDKGAKEAWDKAQFGPYQKLIAKQNEQTGPAFNYRAALSYYFNEEYESSKKYAKMVLETKKDYSGAYILLGKIEDKLGNSQGAIKYYSQAINLEKDPVKKANAQMDLANLHLKGNRPGSALTTIKQAKATEARLMKSSKFLAIQARAEYKSGKFDDAIKSLEMLLQGNLDSKQKAKYSFLLGMAAKKAGEMEKAKTAFKNAMYGPYKPAAELELKELEG
ncbi:MAG: tetratricopeptide repeat protein [Bacteroidia bacterium]|nr:tetratricopeptide repeat protein [Bacteroidia bacterium]